MAAFAIVLRRLRRPGEEGRHGAGVAVIMRYTLRLLTLDQLARASGLVCALELERAADPDRYGVWPFEIGLWVGKAATPNYMGRKGDGKSDSARSKTCSSKPTRKANRSRSLWRVARGAVPDSNPTLSTCVPIQTDRPSCASFASTSSVTSAATAPLPILGVDEPIYRRLPAFLIATVDKFASLPWTAQTGALLGGADRYDNAGFYGGADPGQGSAARSATPGARPGDTGRVAPHLRTPRHYGWAVRDCHRGFVRSGRRH